MYLRKLREGCFASAEAFREEDRYATAAAYTQRDSRGEETGTPVRAASKDEEKGKATRHTSDGGDKSHPRTETSERDEEER